MQTNGSELGAVLPTRGHLVISGDIFGYHVGMEQPLAMTGGAVGSGNPAEIPQGIGRLPPHGMMSPQMCTVLRSKRPTLQLQSWWKRRLLFGFLVYQQDLLGSITCLNAMLLHYIPTHLRLDSKENIKGGCSCTSGQFRKCDSGKALPVSCSGSEMEMMWTPPSGDAQGLAGGKQGMKTVNQLQLYAQDHVETRWCYQYPLLCGCR